MITYPAGHYAPGTEFAIGRITMVANTGTYLDIPAHRFRHGHDLAGLPLERCALLPAVVVDAGIPVVEHLTGLARLPRTGATFTAVPPAVRGLATFPVRAFAQLP